MTNNQHASQTDGSGHWGDVQFQNAISGFIMSCCFLAFCIVLLSSCSQSVEYPIPERITDPIEFDTKQSNAAIPVFLSLDLVQSDMNRKLPRTLWSINEYKPQCVPAQRIKIFKKRLKVTPDLGCTIIGDVRRGKIGLQGRGRDLFLVMPITAKVSARDVGGFLKGETATGSAIVKARVKFFVTKRWALTGKVAIDYNWVEPPGIDFLGQRIRFARQVDKELNKVIAQLEAELQKEVAKVPLRSLVAKAWQAGFTVIELNRERPPAWMRVTPQTLALADYQTQGRRLSLNITASALTETFIGDRPSVAAATALPAPSKKAASSGLDFHIPVISSYKELEPVILRALKKLAARGISVKEVGQVDADFKQVTLYATRGNRLAVGINVEAEIIGRRFGKRFGKTRGTIWLTGIAMHEPNSQVIYIRDLEVVAKTDNKAADLLFRLVNSAQFREELSKSLTQDFSKDYNKVLLAARKAIATRRFGSMHIKASINSVEHGLVRATGQGLYMPIRVRGVAQIDLRR